MALTVYGCYHGHMTRQMTATLAKTRFLSLLDEVEAGETVEIVRHGQLVARLVPARGPAALRGILAGVAVSDADDKDLFSTGTAWEADR